MLKLKRKNPKIKLVQLKQKCKKSATKTKIVQLKMPVKKIEILKKPRTCGFFEICYHKNDKDELLACY